ncbi:MAG: hypothetical protein WCX86_05820 [Candidatus Hydrogenedentales bacterium]
MDLSGLKWPILILVIVGIGFLASSPGINWMVGRYTQATPGQDAEKDQRDEAGLTRVAGYLLYQWRYEASLNVMRSAVDRYGSAGANYLYNKYRMVKCLEKLDKNQQAYNILQELIAASANGIDSRVPNNDNLKLRAQKLKEVHNLQ